MQMQDNEALQLCHTTLQEEGEEGKLIEWSTTIDPTYVIRLIRQLLPSPNGLVSIMPPATMANQNGAETDKKETNKEILADPNVAVNVINTDNFIAVANSRIGKLVDVKCASDGAEENPNVDKPFSEMGRWDPESHQPQEGEGLTEDKTDGFISAMENSSQAPDNQDVQEPGNRKKQDIMTEDDAREEAGCVLWDLAASQSHAEFLVENHILEVLVGILCIPQSDRMREICLGIFGNLACHAKTERAMLKKEGLISTIVQQLFVADAPSLIETCRLLSAGLHSNEANQWEEAIQSDDILKRIMWISANTMNSQLLEKSTELLLAMVDIKKEETSSLVTPLMRLGLPDFLTDLIACEMAAIIEGTSTRGDVVLDIVLRIGEALSLLDDSASELSRKQNFLALACQVIQLSDKDEFGPSAVTAMVLVANLLTENTEFISKAFHYEVVERLVALLPSTGDDPGARNAFWSILGRICKFLVSFKSEKSVDYTSLIKVLASGCYVLVDDLNCHREDDIGEDEDQAIADHNVDAGMSRGLQAKLATLHNLVLIMKEWATSQNKSSNQLQGVVENSCKLIQKQMMVNQGSSGALQSERNSA